MRALRRVVASSLAALLLLAGPLGMPKGCVECPAGCPMHARGIDSAAGKKQPGCHRTAMPAPAAGDCLRSACGHDVTVETAMTVLALPVRPIRVLSPAPGPRLPTPPLVVASLDAPEPALRPPRAAHT